MLRRMPRLTARKIKLLFKINFAKEVTMSYNGEGVRAFVCALDDMQNHLRGYKTVARSQMPCLLQGVQRRACLLQSGVRL